MSMTTEQTSADKGCEMWVKAPEKSSIFRVFFFFLVKLLLSKVENELSRSTHVTGMLSAARGVTKQRFTVFNRQQESHLCTSFQMRKWQNNHILHTLKC